MCIVNQKQNDGVVALFCVENLVLFCKIVFCNYELNQDFVWFDKTPVRGFCYAVMWC